LLNIKQFLQFFFISGLCKKFAIQGHAHRTYFVAILYNMNIQKHTIFADNLKI